MICLGEEKEMKTLIFWVADIFVFEDILLRYRWMIWAVEKAKIQMLRVILLVVLYNIFWTNNIVSCVMEKYIRGKK